MESGRPNPTSPDAGPPAGADWAAFRARLDAVRVALDRAGEPDREAEERILRARARALARSPSPAPEGNEIEVLEFRVAGDAYAIEPRHVREVLPLDTLVPVPGLPEVVRGIASVRGEVLSVLDLRRLFGLPTRGLGEIDYAVVLRSPSMTFAVLADAVVGLRRLTRAAIQPAPTAPGGGGAGYLLGVTVAGTSILDGGRLLADAVQIAGAGASGRDCAPAAPPTGSPPRGGECMENER